MWRSVPQIPVRDTRMSTSLMPTAGRGTSHSSSPGPAAAFIRASTASGLLGLLPDGPQAPPDVEQVVVALVHGPPSVEEDAALLVPPANPDPFPTVVGHLLER